MKKFMKNKKLILIFMLISSLFILSACDTEELSNNLGKDKLRVHFLDVGQADSALIELPNKEVALIDGGNRGDGEFLVDYIKKLQIEKIDYLIATHPHEDHIGGLPEVVKAFDIGKIYMPNKTANTRIFEKLLEEIKNKGLKITQAKSGMTLIDEGDLKFSIVAPKGDDYEKTNDYSIVNKLEYKDVSLLFTGDAERQSESEMINSSTDLSVDILKVGHHGSNSSSTDEFLDKVKPKYAVISCETGNSYGHPHREVLERLEKRNIKVLRIDQIGTIVLDSDGKNAKLSSKDGSVEQTKGQGTENSPSEGKLYIGNVNSKIYHDETCNSLPNAENRKIFNSEEEAKEADYKPHSICIK